MLHDEPSDPIRVLVVDDNKRARRSLATLLASYPQIQVIAEAADGKEAVAMAEEYHPEVVVMDVMMPEMDGIEAARRIKNAGREVAVILITLYGGVEKDATDAGADVFMLKVDSGEEIVKAIERIAPAHQ